MIRPLIVSHSDAMGGAARAAYRLHRALLASRIDSQMYVGHKSTGEWRVAGPQSKYARAIAQVRPTLDALPLRLQRTDNRALHSPAWVCGADLSVINNGKADVINLHWTCRGFLSIEGIGRLRKPVILTMHDMWTFCGAEHYSDDGSTARWRTGYKSEAGRGLDIDRWTWRRKKKAWQTAFQLVSPSNWLAQCAREAALTRDWPIATIPNPLDTATYKPVNKGFAREVLNLPQDKNIVMFGALGGTADPRKGWKHLSVALQRLSAENPSVLGVVFGEAEPRDAPSLGLPLRWVGKATDDEKLTLLYSAADVMVVPSEQENLPQSATEAISCGCPVVLFDAFGMKDVVKHKRTGYLAAPYDPEDLKNGIAWLLADPARLLRISAEARIHAESNWSEAVVGRRYIDLYEDLRQR